MTKMQKLDVWHPGLIEKVHAMFAEFAAMADVRHMVLAQYGERLSVRSLARYKQQHWRVRRELVQQMTEALATRQEFAAEARFGLR
jgi:hypothetical protein